MACAVHTSASKKRVGRLAKRQTKKAVEVKWRKACFARRMTQQDLRIIFGREKVTGAAQPTKGFVIHQRRPCVYVLHRVHCTENLASLGNRKQRKILALFVRVFAKMRRLSFNIHPWLYVKFM